VEDSSNGCLKIIVGWQAGDDKGSVDCVAAIRQVGSAATAPTEVAGGYGITFRGANAVSRADWGGQIVQSYITNTIAPERVGAHTMGAQKRKKEMS